MRKNPENILIYQRRGDMLTITADLRDLREDDTDVIADHPARAGLEELLHRFAGNVMRNNRHCPIVPCHRVVGSKGLGGYGGQKADISKKIELLSREGAI